MRRHKTRDQSHPAWGSYARAGIEYGGYPAVENHWRNERQPTEESGLNSSHDPALSTSIVTGPSIHVIDLTLPATDVSLPVLQPQSNQIRPPDQPISCFPQSDSDHFGGSSVAVPVFDETPHNPFMLGRSHIDALLTNYCTASQRPHPDPLQLDGSRSFPSPRSTTSKAPAPSSNAACSDLIPHSLPTSSQQHTLQPMTPGQASLFGALLSLARPEDRPLGSSWPTPWTPQSSGQIPILADARHGYSSLPTVNDTMIDDLEDTEDVRNSIFDSLALDRNVQSNSVPYILQCYALWMRRFLFEPLRVVRIARDYVSSSYQTSLQSRWKMMLISDIVRTVARSTVFDMDALPNLTTLVEQMNRGFAVVSSRRESSRELDIEGALRALDNAYELISMLCKLSSLTHVLTIMQAAAPVFRRACPDPPEELVHLPSLLTKINVNLQYFATLDILLSTITNRPMFFRYNVEPSAQVDESQFSAEESPGLRWLYGVPDRLVVTLARMNALFEAFESHVDAHIVKELEAEIGTFEPIVSVSVDPGLTARRVVVVECWRQAAFIYLYMGLCGGDSQDARVVRAQERFMSLFKGAKPRRHPDAFLVLPMTILGMATSNPAEQDLIRRRMLGLPECARLGTMGNEIVQILDVIWTSTSAVGRPAMWSDLRLACLRVTGM